MSFVWERGGKISYTNLEPVVGGVAKFHHYLQQTATIVKEEHEFQRKEWSFKMQARSHAWLPAQCVRLQCTERGISAKQWHALLQT